MPRSAGPDDREGSGAGSQRIIDRRRFLQGAVAGLGAIALGEGTAGAATKKRLPARTRRADLVVSDVTPIKLPGGLRAPSARWLVEENARPGTNNWVVTGIQTPHALEGYASQVSAVAGDDVTLFVNTTASAFHVEAYRMGYYQGLGRPADLPERHGGPPGPAARVGGARHQHGLVPLGALAHALASTAPGRPGTTS